MSDAEALLGGAAFTALTCGLWIGGVWWLYRKHFRDHRDHRDAAGEHCADEHCADCGVRRQWHIDNACRSGLKRPPSGL